jgi:hypothetical protein
MGWEVIRSGPKGIRVVFADKTFLDFPKMSGQMLSTGDKYSGELLIGNWTGINDNWVSVATFQKESYSYVIQIP